MKVSGKDIVFVSVQFALFISYFFEFTGRVELSVPWKTAGLLVSILGAFVVLIALLQLNKSLSPFPTPISGGKLRTHGLYAIVRHPIYTGIIMMGLGYGLYQQSTWKWIVSIALLILFYFKSEYEEQLLAEKFKDYPSYKKQTGRSLPKFKKP